MMSRDVPYSENDICDECGKEGAYDYMGDLLCPECATKMSQLRTFDLYEIKEILETHKVDGLDTVIMELDTITDHWYYLLHKYALRDEDGMSRKQFNNDILSFKEAFDKHYGCLRHIASMLDIKMLEANVCPTEYSEMRGEIVKAYLCLICNSSAAKRYLAKDLRESLARNLVEENG